jgi:hypothetical protein
VRVVDRVLVTTRLRRRLPRGGGGGAGVCHILQAAAGRRSASGGGAGGTRLGVDLEAGYRAEFSFFELFKKISIILFIIISCIV